MNELEMTASVLAAVALPLIGIGPMLLRSLRPLAVGVAMAACAAIVWVLTRAPWATAFTLCIGAALLLGHGPMRRRAAAARVTGFSPAPGDGEGDLA